MKKIFSKKNLYLFFMLYTVLTIIVSIYNLFRNNNYDYLGFWHEIYRFFFLLAFLFLVNIIKNFSFKKGLKSIFENLLPLLLTLLAFSLILYLKGDLSLDLIKNIALYALGIIIALALFKAFWSTLSTWFKNIFISNKKKYFSFISLLLIFLILLPCFLYFLIHGFNIITNLFKTNNFYLAGLLFFVLLCVGLLLSTKTKDIITLDVIIVLLLYYVIWFVIGLNNMNIYTIETMQVLAFLAFFLYENNNNYQHCIPFSVITLILILIGAYYI